MIPLLAMLQILYCAGPGGEGMPFPLCIPASKAATAEYEDEEQRIQFLQGYRLGALQAVIGRTYTGSSLDEEDTPFARGYRSGKTHIAEIAKAKKFVSLSEFGYELVALEGVLRLGFEQSHFTAKTGEGSYWIVFPDYMRPKIPKGTWPNGKPVTVKGWLSPKGIYGHMGRAKHELVVHEIQEDTSDTKQDTPPERP